MGDRSSSPARVTSLNSDLSGDRIDAPINSLKNKSTFNQENLASDSMSTEWTNEKHRSYLKSMEASFVNDLYKSFDLLGNKILRRKHMTSSPSGQFKILQRGSCNKLDFESSKKSQTKKVDGPIVLLANPWIQHFKSSRRHQIITSSGCDIVEVSDQNFVDEKDMREKKSYTPSTKRIKTFISPTHSDDQVVPSYGAKFQDRNI